MREEEFGRDVMPGSTFAVPLGSRDLSQLFTEIFDTQYEYERRVSRRREQREQIPKVFGKPSPNSFLKSGQTFHGSQTVTHPNLKTEKWKVHVSFQYCNMDSGEIYGTMTALDVPGTDTPVVTFFDGQIIDNENAIFYSDPDSPARNCFMEMRLWGKFPEFKNLRDSVLENDGRAEGLEKSDFVFMRWKEKGFMSGNDCRLSIDGCYYAAMNRKTGDVTAYYLDTSSAPDQKLVLKSGEEGCGYSLSFIKYA